MAAPAIWKPPKFFGTVKNGVQTMPNWRQLLGQKGATSFLGGAASALSKGGGQPQGGGGNSYSSLLQNYMNQQRADFAAQSTADKGDMINAIRKYMISYGSSPNFDQLGGMGADAQGYLKEALDEKTLGLMKKSDEEGLSSRARLSRENDKAMRMIPAAMAARGMLRSGQTGHDFGEQAQQYKTAGYDMLNELLGGITGTVGGFQQAERDRARALAEAQMNAAMQASQDWGDSYFDQNLGGGDQSPVNLRGTPTTTRGRPPKPGPNFVWNGKRWVRKQQQQTRRGGGGGGKSLVM